MMKLPDNWSISSIGDVATIRKQKSTSCPGIRCLELEHIGQATGKILGWDDSGLQTSVKSTFAKGDVLFGKLRPYLKKYWLADFDGICTTEILPIVADQDQILCNYLFYNVQTENFIEHACSGSYGTKMPRTSWGELSDFQVKLPPLPEQQKIARILSSVDSKLALIDQQITTTQTLKKGLMQKLFTQGFGTQDADGRWQPHTEFQETELGRVPKGWTVKQVKDCGKVITGSTPATKNSEYYNGQKMFVSPADLGSFKYVTRTAKTLTETGFKQTRAVRKGATLFTCIGSTIGKLGLATEEAATNQQINSVIPHSNMNDEYVYYQLAYQADTIKLKAGTQAVPIINKSLFEAQPIICPTDIDEQQEIARILSTVDRKLENLQSQKAQTQQLKKGLMQKLLTGQIRVQPDPQDN